MVSVILPGDQLPIASTSSIIIGPGLQYNSINDKSNSIISSNRAGILGHIPPPTATEGIEKYWVESIKRRYISQSPEPILGIIVARHAEGYRVDIGTSQMASLDALAFEGATKRSKPNLKIGTVIYAHILPTPSFSEPELSCVDAATQKANGFGELEGGFLIRSIELGKCRSLLSPSNPILQSLGSKFPFELAVGMNGRIWVKVDEKLQDSEEKMIELIKILS